MVRPTFWSLLWASLLLTLWGRDATTTADDIDDQRVINARRMMVVDADDFDDIIDLWADDINYQDAVVDIFGKEDFYDFLSKLFVFMTEYALEIDDEVYQGDSYMCTWRMYGKSQPNIATAPEVPFDAKGMSIMKFRPGEVQPYYHKDLFTEGDIWSEIPYLGVYVRVMRELYLNQVAG